MSRIHEYNPLSNPKHDPTLNTNPKSSQALILTPNQIGLVLGLGSSLGLDLGCVGEILDMELLPIYVAIWLKADNQILWFGIRNVQKQL